MTTSATLPDHQQLLDLCQWMGLSTPFTERLAQALPVLQADPTVPERFARDYHHYLTCPDYEKFKPTQADALSFYYAFIYLQAVPAMRESHRARQIPEAIIQRTARDMERWFHRYHEQHGMWGFDLINWSAVYAHKRLIALGRLGFEVTTFPPYCHVPQEAGGEAVLKAGDPVISVHIPAEDRLLPADCDQAFAQAREFFPRYFPEHDYKAFICVSWMMDRQLALYLPPESNLVHFLNRFQPAPLDNPNDDSFWSFIFNIDKRPQNLADVPRDTKLRRIILEHIEKGGRWQGMGGYIPGK